MSSTTSLDDSRPPEWQRPSGEDGEGSNADYESRFQSQQFDSSFSNFDAHPLKDFPGGDSSQSNHEDLSSQETQSSPLIYSSEGPDGPILPSPSVMVKEEGFALREWRRLNALRLEAKENEEKEMVRKIIEEAEQYKADFYKKLSITIENTKKTNREKEKLFMESQEKFHAEAGKHNWKAVAELIPREVPIIEKKGKKKVAITVIQGPKPGKPTDLSRMRQVLTRLKHNPPPHMKPKVLSPPPSSMEGKTNGSPLHDAPSVMAAP